MSSWYLTLTHYRYPAECPHCHSNHSSWGIIEGEDLSCLYCGYDAPDYFSKEVIALRSKHRANKRYKRTHPEAIQASNAKYYREHQESERLRQIKWRRANPGKMREYGGRAKEYKRNWMREKRRLDKMPVLC